MIDNLIYNLPSQHLGVGLGVATLLGGYGFLKYGRHKKAKVESIAIMTRANKDKKQQVKDWMAKDFANRIIKWKCKNKGEEDNYLLFIRDIFPENIKIGPFGKVEWIDPRVSGERWLGEFSKVNASDQLYELEAPPGVGKIM